MLPRNYIFPVILLVSIVTAIVSGVSAKVFTESEKALLYANSIEIASENDQLRSEVVEQQKQIDIMSNYIDLLYASGVIPSPTDGKIAIEATNEPDLSPEATPTPEPTLFDEDPSPIVITATIGYVPVLIPTLPPIKFDFATVTPEGQEATATPFRG